MEWAGWEGDPLGYKSTLVEAEQLFSTGLHRAAAQYWIAQSSCSVLDCACVQISGALGGQ